ncbi:hypothetical protein JHJ32_21950 [Parapedobacter sp. ISTM3]|uniref:hypothetical protein n=1 Tax=Parapedobacter sp. ISTM3 TaxID=2800130 RepID=UPI0019089594|nr:hypothetical protein [Parapedobacter sp. ISTM3]MBK1442679.1 hypothetical protein [Parapedobacter sp. ISTM3]
MKSLRDINLKRNPFSDTTPSRDRHGYFWAGMTSVKEKIQDCYESCLSSNTKQLILNWGPYGGGKTFSAYYFLDKYSNKKNNITQVYLRSPKDGSKLAREIFNAIIDELTFEAIAERVKSLKKNFTEQNLLRYLSSKAGVEYAKAIITIGSDDEDIQGLMNRFLYTGTLTASEMRSLGLAKPIKTDSDLIKFLTGLLSCFAISQGRQKGRLVIWFDEMEDIIYYPTKHYKAFSQFLRDLYDNVSDNLLIFLNFTLAEGEESTIELILGTALWSRITRKIRYKDFNYNDAFQYADDLLNEVRIDKQNPQPISEQNLKKLLSILPLGNLTPREINKHMSSIINFLKLKDLTEIDDVVINGFVEQQDDL